MGIRLLETVRVAGAVQAAGTALTLDAETEALLVGRKQAIYTTPEGLRQGLPTGYSTLRIRRRVAVGIIGQSNERGEARDSSGSYAITFRSALTGQSDPIPPAIAARGTWWIPLADMLAANGVEARFINGGIGGASFSKHFVGQIPFYSASTGYFGARESVGTGEPGDYGDVVTVGSRLFRCTTGRARFAYYPGFTAIPTFGGSRIDYIYIPTGQTQATGSSAPDWAGATNINDTVSDGTITWTLVQTSGAKAQGSVLASGDLGFDPLGLLARTKAALDAVENVDERWVFLSNGQSDAQGNEGSQNTVRGWYETALTSITNWAIAQGYKVAIGFTCYNPGSPTYQYDTLSTARANVLASFAAGANAASVIGGADLYRSMGTALRSAGLVYPEPGAPSAAPHLTDEGMLLAAGHWFDALKAAGW